MSNTKNIKIINDIILNYRSAQKYLRSFTPSVARLRSQHYENYQFSYIVILLKLFFVNPFYFRRNSAKYIFQNLRYKEIIRQFNPSEVLVLGDISEFNYCKINKYKFHWIGYLFHSFCIFLSKKNNIYLNKSINFIKKTIGENNNYHRYLFLWTDQDISGLVLSSIFKNIKNFSVICIAHGFHFHPKNNFFYLPDGHFCKYNLVWDSKQISFFKNLKIEPMVLGLPYQIKLPKIISNKIIIVGHGVTEQNEYHKAIAHFRKIYSLINKKVFDIEYRPHPNENIEKIKKYFPKINKDKKKNLFKDSQKIYIGFVSSLLYEASMHQNHVIGLDTSFLNYYLDFKFEKVFQYSEYSSLNSYLISLKSINKRNIINNEDIKIRIMHCLNKIDKHNKNIIN